MARSASAVLSLGLTLVVAVVGALSGTASAQFGRTTATSGGVSPVTVDDSPSALLLIQRAVDQALPNPPDAIRALQEVLDDLGDKLVPVDDEESDRLVSARQAAHSVLRRHPSLLERYRQTEAARGRAMLERGELDRVWRTRMLTSAGLRAGLLLAESAVEEARFAVAAALLAELAEHPELTVRELAARDTEGAVREPAVHLDRLRGMAAHATGDLDAAIAALDRLDAQRSSLAAASATSLRRMIDGGAVTLRLGRGTLDGGVAPLPTPTSWHLIAREPMPASLFNRLYAAIDDADQSRRRGIDSTRLIGSMLTAAPTVRGHVVYVNEGSSVRAFDRLSGRTHWVTSIGGGGVGRDGSPAGDLNAIAIVDGHLVTVDGHAHATERSSTARITCLDPSTGRIRWSTALDRLELDAAQEIALGNLSPHGAPVILDGLVFTLARKVTPRFEIVSYLVALDLTDGSLRWLRHLCSAAGARLSGLRPHTTLAVSEGALYATLSTGAVARIDSRSGEIAWIVRVPVPIRDPRYLSEPWEIGAAVPTSRGILTVAPDQRDVLLLDVDTGRELERHRIDVDAPFGLARYLLLTRDEIGEIILSVGSDVVAFRIEDLTAPLWSLSTSEPELAGDTEQRSGVRGRVHVADGMLAVPTSERVLVLDAASGTRWHEIAVGGAGNPLLFGPQLILATHDAVECHMPFGAAEGLIRDRLRDQPRVAAHGLALIGLGLRARSLETCLDGAEATLMALADASDPVSASAERSELFDALLAIEGARMAESADDGAALHAIMARVAEEPWQRTMRRIVHGEWLERRGLLAEASAMWQEILDSATLSSAAVPLGDTRLAGAAAARVRLRELITTHGVAAVATQADAAERELAELVASSAPVPELLALARRRPMTPAAGTAILHAAAVATEANAPRLALEALLWGWRDEIGVTAQRRPIVEAAIELSIAARWWRLAHDMTATAAIEGLVDGDLWRAKIAEAGGGIARPPAKIGAFAGAGSELRGGLVPPAGAARPLGFRDRVLLADGFELVMVDAELSERWRTTLSSSAIELLAADERGILVSTRSAEAVRVVSIDAGTGEVRWESPPLDDLLPTPRGRREGDRREPGDLAVPIPIGEDILVLRRDGMAARLSARDGTSVMWQTTSSLRLLRAVSIQDAAIVLAGVEASGGAELVVVIDPASGREALRHRPQTGTEVRWLSASPLGLALVGTDTGIEAIETLSDRSTVTVAWSIASDVVRGTLRGWTTPRWLLVADHMERLLGLRLADGRLEKDRFALPNRVNPGALALREILVDEVGIAVMYDRRVIEFGHDGVIRGMDAATDDQNQRLLVAAQGTLMPVGLAGVAQVEIAPGVHRTQHDHRIHLLDRTTGLRLLGPPLRLGSVGRPFEQAEAIDGWLMLSSGIATIAIPLVDG